MGSCCALTLGGPFLAPGFADSASPRCKNSFLKSTSRMLFTLKARHFCVSASRQPRGLCLNARDARFGKIPTDAVSSLGRKIGGENRSSHLPGWGGVLPRRSSSGATIRRMPDCGLARGQDVRECGRRRPPEGYLAGFCSIAPRPCQRQISAPDGSVVSMPSAHA